MKNPGFCRCRERNATRINADEHGFKSIRGIRGNPCPIFSMIRILSLDDDLDLLKLYSLILERGGYDHTASADSYEAWILLHADRFDLFFQDIFQTDISSEEFLEAIEKDPALSSLPILAFTAKSAESARLGCYPKWMARIDIYITKPFHPDELLEQARRICLRHGLTPPINSSREAVRTHSITEALQDNDPDMRLTAAKAAGALADPTLVQPLANLLEDSSRDVANTALRALGQLNDPDGRAVILPLLHRPDWRLRCLAALALQSNKDESVEAALLPLLNDEVNLVQLAVMLALKERSSGDVVEALSVHLSSVDEWLRDATIATLGSTRNPLAVEKLIPLLADADSEVGCRAIDAMQKLGGSALPTLRGLAEQNKNIPVNKYDVPVNKSDRDKWRIAKAASQAVYAIENNLQG